MLRHVVTIEPAQTIVAGEKLLPSYLDKPVHVIFAEDVSPWQLTWEVANSAATRAFDDGSFDAEGAIRVHRAHFWPKKF